MSIRVGLTRLGRTRTLPWSPNHGQCSHHRNVATSSARLTACMSPNIQSLVKRLDRATSHKQMNDIHNSYLAIVAQQKKESNPGISSPLTKEHFIAVLDALGSSGRPADITLITDVASHMPNVFGMDLTIDVHDAILRAYIRNGHIHSACNWLQNMSLTPGHHTPTRAQWHLFLEGIEDGTVKGSFRYLRNAIKLMRPSGCKPNNDTYKILIRARWSTHKDSHPHVIVFKTVVDDIKKDGLPYDPSVASLLYDSYANRGFIRQAIEIYRYYQSVFPEGVTLTEQLERQWNDQLSDAAHGDGVKGALLLFKTLQQDGCRISPSSFKAMLRHSRSISDIHALERALGLHASVVHWSIVVSNITRSGQIPDAILAYEESKKAGILPDAALVGPIIRSLCMTAIKPPTEAAIDQALALYHDLLKATPIPRDYHENENSRSIGPDVDIYQSLLRALASSSNQDKYFPKATSLLDDMRKRDISFTDSLTTTSLIVLLMRNASSLSEAFNFYRRLCKGLGSKGYSIVLNEFCKLSFSPKDHLPALPRYFEMVKDMRQAGHTMTPEVYTILLRQLAIVGTRINWKDSPISPDIRQDLTAAVRRAHDLMTLDASILPDAALLNQLMDTYQRLGCFGDAYRVWEMMYLSGRFDHISVSIILDACGHAGAWEVAKEVCVRLNKDNFMFNQRNWNTWLECLCRLGKLNEAVKAACLEMGKNQDDVAPDTESARILLTFARKVNQQAEVISRIKRYLPELWERLPDDMRTN